MSSETSQKSSRQRIGKYEVVEHIATGGMGAVYKAIDTDLKRVVALKILSPEMATNKIMLARFKREARSAAKLRHENIVAIYEYNEDKDTHYLALEFVDGKDLHDVITKKGKLAIPEACEILRQAARALDHAHAVKIVHRDIKPSNFLITHVNGKMLVKLTDLGLAREVNDEEFQVTRPGTTVGTVDYMAPEQARDSKSADIRSDIYSLGCTLYHMLAGAAPFAQGSLTERLYKHIEMTPPDIKRINPGVPNFLVGILERMLAKHPDDRYQTPAALLEELDALEASATAEPTAVDTPRPVKRAATQSKARPASTSEHKAPPTKVKKLKPTSETEPRKRRPPKPKKLARWWPVAAGASGLLVLAVILGLIVANSGDPELPPEPPPEPPALVNIEPKVIFPLVEPKEIQVKQEEEPPPLVLGPDAPEYKRLYRPSYSFDGKYRQRLWHELAGPFVFMAPEVAASTTALLPGPGGVGPLLAACGLNPQFNHHHEFLKPGSNVPVLRVSRFADMGPTSFRTLADAFAKAPAGQVVIEIHDNGPLFVPAMPELRDRQVWLRGGAGYRPLLAWFPANENVASFLSILGGKLILEDLDIVVRWSEAAAEKSACFVNVIDGEFHGRRCTFSTSGDAPVALVNFSRSTLASSASKPALRCRLSQVYARGGDLAALNSFGCPVDALLDRCLIVGGERPLFDVVGQDTDIHPSMLRLFRTTLVSTGTLLRIRNLKDQTNSPRLQCLCWDSLLACASNGPDTTMVQIGNGGRADNLQWRPTNTLYIGWKTLLDAGSKRISAGALATWRARWFYEEGDAELPQETWPTALPAHPGEAPASIYDPRASIFGFAATSGPGLIGADFGRLPAAPQRWLERTYESYVLAPIPLLDMMTPPAIPDPGDGKYHGERIDVSQVNFGTLLQQRLRDHKDTLGPRIVLLLTGAGECPTAACRITGVKELVIYAASTQDGNTAFTLVPDETAADQVALFDMNEGNLDMVGLHIRYANSKFALVPNHMVKMRQGSLNLLRCLLHGPTKQCPPSFVGLVSFENNRTTSSASTLGINESILVSSKNLIGIHAGDCRLRIRESVLAGADDVMSIDTAGTYLVDIKLQCMFDSSTFAFGKALLSFKWKGEGFAAGESFVLQSTRSLFLDPFAQQPKTSSLLVSDRRSLAQGILRWQGDGNGFDPKRYGSWLSVADAKSCNSIAEWEHFWGPNSEQHPRLLDLLDKKTCVMNPDEPDLERLALPTTIRPMPGERLPGADLFALGILNRKFK